LAIEKSIGPFTKHPAPNCWQIARRPRLSRAGNFYKLAFHYVPVPGLLQMMEFKFSASLGGRAWWLGGL
jgi:hypothetical protein